MREAISHKDDYQQAYIYGFPMIAAYKAMCEFTIDKTNSQYKAPFNQIRSDSKTFTPKDTAIVTPNADTPYSLVEMDLRAEPLVICVPKVEKGRYYAVQLSGLLFLQCGIYREPRYRQRSRLLPDRRAGLERRYARGNREGISRRDAVRNCDFPHPALQRG